MTTATFMDELMGLFETTASLPLAPHARQGEQDHDAQAEREQHKEADDKEHDRSDTDKAQDDNAEREPDMFDSSFVWIPRADKTLVNARVCYSNVYEKLKRWISLKEPEMHRRIRMKNSRQFKRTARRASTLLHACFRDYPTYVLMHLVPAVSAEQ
jgi:ABC-type Zn2+ transport system substrate-binding protein/surface adhesin